MRVALDEQIFAIQPYGGISRMFAELANQFVDDAVPGVEVLPFHAPIVNHYILDNPKLHRALGARPARNQWTALAQYFARLGVKVDADIVHNTFYLPHGLVPIGDARRIVTIHDMIPELMPHTRRRLDWLTLKRRYVDNADHIICVSEATKQDLIKVYGIPQAPISVIHHGVDPRFHPGHAKADFLPDRYLLFVGNRTQYKDADVLFAAFAQIASSQSDLDLVCIGGTDFTPAETRRLEQLGIKGRVSQRYLDDETMASTYAHAEAFVFPSHFEGFGLPALEAMACGTPVVLANATSLPEVGGDAAVYFEPGSFADLTHVLSDLLADDAARADLIQRGLDRAADFTWRAAAQQTADVYAATAR